MPSTAGPPMAPLLHLNSSHQHNVSESYSLTDDFTVCHLSGLGVVTNQIYREDGQRREEHPCEDVCFHFKMEQSIYLYGLFDGYDGSRASDFAAQQMPAELLLGELNGKIGDKQIRETLEQAFISVEKTFFKSIDDLLAEKAKLQMELPEGITQYEAYKQFPDVVQRLQTLTAEISGGTTAVLALIVGDKLYIANVGDSRAVLCREDPPGCLVVEQLSVDHDLQNEDERLRLKNMNLDVERILQIQKLGNHHNTRCIGNYSVKGGYKDFDFLSSAISEPVIATPSICGGLTINDTWRFLLLMSDGLYRSLEESTGSKQANTDIAYIVYEQFGIQSTLMGVAQAAVDKVVRLHHDAYMSTPLKYQKRDDISLLVRNFNQPLPNSINKTPSPGVGRHLPSFTPTLTSAKATTTTASATASTVTTVGPTNYSGRINSTRMVIDEDGYIEPYVDFSDFYAAIQETQQFSIYGPSSGCQDQSLDGT